MLLEELGLGLRWAPLEAREGGEAEAEDDIEDCGLFEAELLLDPEAEAGLLRCQPCV